MSRQIMTATRADGTRSTYSLQPGSTVPMQLEALKPLKPSRIKADRRTYPKHKPGMSTAEYVALYEAANNSGMHCASFWQPLNTAPGTGYTGLDSVEHGDFEQLADDGAPVVAMEAPAEPAAAAPVVAEPAAESVQPIEPAPAAAPIPWQILAARPAATYCTPVRTIGVHEWACVVYTHELYGPCTDYVWRRVDQNRGAFRRGSEWPTYDSNRGNHGQPSTVAKLYADHQAEIRAALDAGRPAALQAWQAVAARAGVDPVATDAEAAAMAGACLARYGSTDPAACVHLASFAGWHADTLQQLRAAAAPEPAPAAPPAADPAPWRGPENAAARARVYSVHVRTAAVAQALAPTWHADGCQLRRSVNAPGFDAASQQLRDAVAAALRAERAAAAADPVPVPVVSPADDGGFRARVEKAAAWIGTGRPTSRAFDSCFEMWDGAAVCVALLERAQRRPDTKLAANLWRYLARHHVEKVASERPRGLSLAEWSRQLVARSAPAELPPEPAPPAAPAAAAAPVHPRMAEALAILTAAVQPVDPDAAADAAACADDALARVYGDAVADAVADAMAAAPPAGPVRTARDGVDDRAARLAALLVGIIGTDPARLAPALRRESARVAAAAESVPGRIADGYRRTARALADMATAEHARAAPDLDTLAPDAPRPDPAALVAELDQITAAARDRMGGRTGSELSAMTPAELARRHAILQQLPTFAEERQAARQRIAARLAARQARPAPALAAPPAEGWRTIAARPAPAGAFAGLAMLAPGAPCGDIGAAARLPAAAPAGWRWRPDAPVWRGRQPAGAFPEPIGAAGGTRCSDIGAAAAGLTGAPEAVTRIHRGWPACTMSTRPGGIATRVRRPGADPGPPRVATSAHQYGAGPAPPARSRHHCTLTPPPSVATSARQGPIEGVRHACD